MMWWELALAGGLVVWALLYVSGRQREFQERKRLMTHLWLEISGHEEVLAVCDKARYAVPLDMSDWSWLRYRLAGLLDDEVMGRLAAYYNGLYAAWNVQIEKSGQSLDDRLSRVLRGLQEANARVYKLLEQEQARLNERHFFFIPWYREDFARAARFRLRQRVNGGKPLAAGEAAVTREGAGKVVGSRHEG